MNKFTPVEVHDSNKKFTGWKSKPSNKMRFEADQYGTIYCGIHHGRSNRFQPATQPADGVISRTIVLSDCRLLLIVEEHGGGLVHHLRDCSLVEEEVTGLSLAAPKAILVPVTMASLAMFMVRSVSLDMERGMGVVQQAVKEGNARE
jgi:hypothetical protein